MCIKRGGGGGLGVRTPPGKVQNIGFLSKTGSDHLKTKKLTFQHSALGHHRPTSETPFKWRNTGGPLMARWYRFMDPPYPHQTMTKKEKKSDPSDKTFRIRACLPRGAVRWPVVYECIVLFCCFTSQVNSYGHCGTVSSPNHTFSWAGLKKRLTSNSCTYFRL